MSWLWWGLGAWIAVDIAAAALWAAHGRRVKRRQEIRNTLRSIGRERAREAALDRIPHQNRRTEEDQ